MPTDHTDKHRWDHTGLLRAARSRPLDGREPQGRKSALKTSFRIGFPTQRLAFLERKPRHPSSSFNRWEGHPSLPTREEVRQNRRANSTSAGEKNGCDERLRSEQTDFSPVTGDPIACRSGESPRSHDANSAITPWCLGGCDVGGRVDLRYLRDLRANRAGGWSAPSER